MHRYPTATVAPFSLLVPVFGMLSGVAFLGEPMAWWKAGAAILVVGGLALNQLEGPLLAFLERFDTSSEGDPHG
jgi:O-acetylserine/cysteine efflux transporter